MQSPFTTHSGPVTSADFAYQRLRTQIVTGELEAGSKIIQAELSKKLGVSVTPVREALQRLEAEGLVTGEAHRTSSVVGLQIEDAREIYTLRILIEDMLHEAGIPALTETSAEEAEALCDLMNRTSDPIKFSAWNRQFHQLITGGLTGWTIRIAEALRTAAAPYVAYSLRKNPEHMTESNKDHYALLDSYRNKDLNAASKIMKRHLSGTLSLLEESLGRQS